MTSYYDTSALVKLFVTEKNSDLVAGQIRRGRSVTSRFAEVEIGSAICRRLREGAMGEIVADAMLADIRPLLAGFSVIEVNAAVVARAQVLMRRHALRAGDAIHLATSLVAHAAGAESVRFLSFDLRLNTAARSEGLLVLDVAAI